MGSGGGSLPFSAAPPPMFPAPAGELASPALVFPALRCHRDCGAATGAPRSPRTFPTTSLGDDNESGYIGGMTKIEKLEHEVRSLSPKELANFRRWFAEFDAAQWDAQIERDAGDGRLDSLANEALAEHQAGRSRKL